NKSKNIIIDNFLNDNSDNQCYDQNNVQNNSDYNDYYSNDNNDNVDNVDNVNKNIINTKNNIKNIKNVNTQNKKLNSNMYDDNIWILYKIFKIYDNKGFKRISYTASTMGRVLFVDIINLRDHSNNKSSKLVNLRDNLQNIKYKLLSVCKCKCIENIKYETILN